MYEELPSGSLSVLVITLAAIGFILGIVLFMKDPRTNRRRSIKGGIATFLISVTAFAILFPPAFERDERQERAMERNIMAKYNANFFDGYLKKVEHVGGGGRYESGKYFNLTYGDCTTQERKFHFNYKTGEPISYSMLPDKSVVRTQVYKGADCVTTMAMTRGPR